MEEENRDKERIKEYYYQERINLVKGILSKRKEERKDFLAEKELLKELQTWPKNLSLSLEIKEKILITFPELSLLEYQRFEHVFCVIEYFHRLVSGSFDYFVNTLHINGKERPANETLANYIKNLESLHNIYNSLKGEEKEILWLITILHDIGDIGEHAKHCGRVAELIRLILASSNYSVDNINLVSNVVKYHIYPGMVAQGERTPRSLIKAIKSISKEEEVHDKFLNFLIIFHTMDLAGWRAGKNSLTLDSLKRRMEYLDKMKLEGLTKNFWWYRLKELSKEDFFAPIKPEYVEKIWGQINQLISKEEKKFFEKHLNETVDLEDCMPIIQSLSSIGQSSTESAKKFVKMFRFFAQYAELYGTNYTLITSNHYPLDKEYEFVLYYINKCLEGVPDQMSKNELKEHFENNNKSSFYNIPIKVDKESKYKMIFDIDKMIEQNRV
jgi:hypothetical protein